MKPMSKRVTLFTREHLIQLNLMDGHICRTYSFNNKMFLTVSRDWVLDPSYVDK